MHITPGKRHNLEMFHYGHHDIENVTEYSYFGTVINARGNFSSAKANLKNKSMKALFSVWKAITVCKSPDTNLANKMFDTLIKPILLYNHEIWGAEVPTVL